jgi:hypothetical protein
MVDRAILALESARFEHAEALHIEALAAEAAHGTPRFEGNVAMSLARLYAETGRLDDAAALADRALVLHGALGNPTAEAIALSLQALVAEERGDLDSAEATFLRALEIHEALGNPRSVGVALSNLGRVAHLRGDLSAATERHARAIAALREAGERRLLPYALAVQRAVRIELEEETAPGEPSDDPAIVAMHAMIEAWARGEALPEVGPRRNARRTFGSYATCCDQRARPMRSRDGYAPVREGWTHGARPEPDRGECVPLPPVTSSSNRCPRRIGEVLGTRSRSGSSDVQAASPAARAAFLLWSRHARAARAATSSSGRFASSRTTWIGSPARSRSRREDPLRGAHAKSSARFRYLATPQAIARRLYGVTAPSGDGGHAGVHAVAAARRSSG